MCTNIVVFDKTVCFNSQKSQVSCEVPNSLRVYQRYLTMSEIFDAYCDDLKFLATDLKNNLEVLRSGENFDSARKTIQAVLDQSNDLVKQVEVEVRGHSSQERRVLTEKLKVYKDEFFQLKQEFDSVVFQSQKSQLVGKSGEDRGRMLETNEK